MNKQTRNWDGLNRQIRREIAPFLIPVEEAEEKNAAKVLAAFREFHISESHFAPTSGYGYGDFGRDTLDQVFARIFGAEAALVRPHFVSGTHAIAVAVLGNVIPGDEVIAATGTPYDTLAEVIGHKCHAPGSLTAIGVAYKEIPLTADQDIDLPAVLQAITPRTRVVMLQRSRGYVWRPSFSVSKLGSVIAAIKEKFPQVICFVDNCYGEFAEETEPTEVGADLIAGSLIKNPGGGVAPTGGYIAGKREYVERAACRLTAPGIGAKVGSNPAGYRLFYQGLFLAPHITAEAIKGAIFAGALFSRLGFEVSPLPAEKRTDIIQAIGFGTPERLIGFCQGLQHGSAVDSHVTPEPWGMPGYEDAVVMAGGTFVQGSSIELSADGPLRPPYAAYLQGGLAFAYTRQSLILAAQEMEARGLLKD